MTRISILPAIALLLMPGAARGLEWTQEKVSIAAGPLDEKAEGVFGFRNSKDSAVTITSVRSSCGCTVPNLDKRTYAPGESGELRAVFEFGGRTGHQSKTVTVTTDEGGETTYSLVLEVDIAKLYEVSRQFVVWRRGQTAEPQTIDVRVFEPDSMRLAGVESRDKRFTAVIESTGEPGLHRIVITPATTGEVVQAPIVVTTDFPKENPRTITIYALIR